jgi:deazaflavin-dependent oxidoreductase (nitroreductase family)
VLRLAGRRLLPLYAVIHHRGRVSGREYSTPVVVLRSGDFLLFPLAFGEGAGWVRNLVAAGGGTVRWRGTDHHVTDPQVIDAVGALGPGSPHPWPIRMLALHVFRIKGFLRARRLDVAAVRVS